jgi:hypothetical protein
MESVEEDGLFLFSPVLSDATDDALEVSNFFCRPTLFQMFEKKVHFVQPRIF